MNTPLMNIENAQAVNKSHLMPDRMSWLMLKAAWHRLWGVNVTKLAKNREWDALESTLKLPLMGGIGWRDLEGCAKHALEGLAPARVLLEIAKAGADPFDAELEEKYPAGCLGALMDAQQWSEAAELMQACLKSPQGVRLIRNIHSRVPLMSLIARKVVKRAAGQPWRVDGPYIEQCLEAALKVGISFDEADAYGISALHIACGEPEPGVQVPPLRSCSELVELLLDKGASLERVSRIEHRSALMSAARFGAVDALTVLLRRGASVHLKDHEGNTALHHACFGAKADQRAYRFFKKNATALMESGANAGESNYQGETARGILSSTGGATPVLSQQRHARLERALETVGSGLEAEALAEGLGTMGVGVKTRRSL